MYTGSGIPSVGRGVRGLICESVRPADWSGGGKEVKMPLRHGQPPDFISPVGVGLGGSRQED